MRSVALLLIVATAAPAAAQDTHVVSVSGTTFSPDALDVESGDTVEWQNTSGCHNVSETTASGPAGFGSGPIACAPWTYSFTFNVPGEYTYVCESHVGLGMTGTVTVVPPTGIENAPESSARMDIGPNPFSGVLRMELAVLVDASVRVVVLDLTGREVAILYEGPVSSVRPLPLAWEPAASIAPGSYIVNVAADKFTLSRSVILAR
jgi:plastocyanin